MQPSDDMASKKCMSRGPWYVSTTQVPIYLPPLPLPLSEKPPENPFSVFSSVDKVAMHDKITKTHYRRIAYQQFELSTERALEAIHTRLFRNRKQ